MNNQSTPLPYKNNNNNNKRGNKNRRSFLQCTPFRCFVLLMVIFFIFDLAYLFSIRDSILIPSNIENQSQNNNNNNLNDNNKQGNQQWLLQPITDPNNSNKNETLIRTGLGLHQINILNAHKEVPTMSNDREPIFRILSQAGINKDDLDQQTIQQLPTWSQIQKLIGTYPKIIGLEKCEQFRANTNASVRFFGIAGTFNTGTNLLAQLMIENCQITERMLAFGNQSKGIRWQVPWGKHYPASFRTGHFTDTDHDVPPENSLPLVTIRDPYMWMQSMCRHNYGAHWAHDRNIHCPNIVPTKEDVHAFPRLHGSATVPVTIHYSDALHMEHKSLPNLWNDWYELYYNATFPRIMVRFEDLLFYGQHVEEELCKCGGGVVREDRKYDHFVHISESAKLGTSAHGKHKTDLVGALTKYGTFTHRLDNMTESDIIAAHGILNVELMHAFGYKFAE